MRSFRPGCAITLSASTSCAILLACFTLWAGPAPIEISGASGLTASLNTDGSYSVWSQAPAWKFGGVLGSAPSNAIVQSASDGAGPYTEIAFDYQADTIRHCRIRVYANHTAVLFSIQYGGAARNRTPFPTLSQLPDTKRHLTFEGSFSVPSFFSFSTSGPWALFDASANTVILSPASNFMTARIAWNSQHEIESGIAPSIDTLPPGFTHSTLLVIEPGINRAFETWGHIMTDLAEKARLANDADLSVRKLGYWTDAGAAYYYRTAHDRSYTDTLLAVKAEFDAAGLGLGYMQLDSWFYPKGPKEQWQDNAEGMYEYEASEALFPGGLAGFQRTLGVPLITHARWIDPHSPYHREYRTSGNVVVDPIYWRRIAKYLQESGVVAYEQDWLGKKAETALNLTDPEAFLTNMARAMERAGLTMQYCMPTPAHLMQSTRFPNITSVRSSEDRLNPMRWMHLVYSGRLASALGLWPFADVFLSSEIDNLLIATLMAGPVGIGDAVGAINKENLLHAVRRDGVIVKPDVPLTPVDKSFLNNAANAAAPVIASTYTDFDGVRATYVFGFDRGTGVAPELVYSDVGVSAPSYAFDYFSGSGKLVSAGDAFPAPPVNGRMYTIIVPVGASGMAVVGDANHFVSLGKQRIARLVDDGRVQMSIHFSTGEPFRTIHGYAPSLPQASASEGSAGSMRYDATTKQFAVDVAPGADLRATIQLWR